MNTKAPTGGVLLDYVLHVGVNLHGHLDSSLHTRPSTTYSMNSRKQLSIGSLPISSTRIVLRNIPTNDTIGRSSLPRLQSLLPFSFTLPRRRQTRTMSTPSFTPSSAKIRKGARKGRTMRVVEMLTEQHPKTTLGTALSAMYSVATHKAMIGGKEQVRIGTSQS
jgi:hypothetical protein